MLEDVGMPLLDWQARDSGNSLEQTKELGSVEFPAFLAREQVI
jgi:hypothetical protein